MYNFLPKFNDFSFANKFYLTRKYTRPRAEDKKREERQREGERREERDRKMLLLLLCLHSHLLGWRKKKTKMSSTWNKKRWAAKAAAGWQIQMPPPPSSTPTVATSPYHHPPTQARPDCVQVPSTAGAGVFALRLPFNYFAANKHKQDLFSRQKSWANSIWICLCWPFTAYRTI